MKKLAVVMRVFVFFIIGIVIFFLLSPIFIPKTVNEQLGYYRAILQGFYAEPKDSLDVVIMGDSSVYKGISPIKMWENWGFASYNFASPSQRMWDNYYCLQEVLKYQKPKVVVLNVDQAFNETPMMESRMRHLYDNLPNSINKVTAILDLAQENKIEDIATLIFPIFRFHTRWNELTDDDFQLAHTNFYYSFKGYQMTKGVKAFKGNKDYMKKENKKNKIGPKAQKYLEKIRETCRENNIQLLLIETPAPQTWNKTKHLEIQKWAVKNSVPFFDMNLEKEGLDMNWEEDTQDKGYHMNVKGAEKISACLGNYLKTQYQLPDHRQDSSFAQWRKDTEEYESKKQQMYEMMNQKQLKK